MLYFLTEKKVRYLIFIFWNLMFTTIDVTELSWNDMQLRNIYKKKHYNIYNTQNLLKYYEIICFNFP